MSEKKYYWLKLPRDYFKRHDIRYIKTLPSGRDIAFFYIELMAESVDHDGSLRFSPEIPYSNDMLAVITETPIEIVENSMKVLKELGLVEISEDGTIVLPKVEKMIGSAGDSDNARRQQRYRDRKKAERQALLMENVTHNVTHNVTVTTNSNESKSKSKSKSKSIEEKYIKEKNVSRFVPPTLEEVSAYCLERNNGVDPQRFIDFYSSKGWMIGSNKMKDWKAAVRTWEQNNRSRAPVPNRPADTGNQFFSMLAQGDGT